MRYQVDICIEASPHDDEPDCMKYESVHFDDHKKAISFAKKNAHRDIYGEVHIHHYTEDLYGKEYYPEKMEIISLTA